MTTSSDVPGRKPVGHVRLNMPEGDVPSDATIIVSGPPRSGTSFVAAALHAANLPLGDLIDHTIFEDLELSALLPTPRDILQQLDLAWLRPLDSRALRRLIAQRNAAFARWGFKRPSIAPALVGHSGKALFRHPRLVMIFRDPVALAERVAMAEGLDFDTALHITRRHNDRNLWTARYAMMPVLFVSYEKAIAKRDAFFAELFDFCGLDVAAADYSRIGTFVETAGRSYLKAAAGPTIGYVNRYTAGVLYGWCRIPGQTGADVVDIYADDIKVATARADEFRPALRKAGIGRGRHGFSVKLDHLNLPETCRIRAKVAGSDVEITNSGLALGELRMDAASPP